MTMRDAVIAVFGEYKPVTYTMADGMTVVPEGMAGVDWSYVGGILIFAIAFYSFFRFLGGVFKK